MPSQAYSDIAIIYNPNSTGNAEANAKDLLAELKEALPDIPVKLLPTTHAGHAVELSYAFAKRHKKPLIIAASGDGGYNEVINGALRAQSEGAAPICAVLPSGNANDHARTMQKRPLPELIREQRISEIEIMKVAFRDANGKETVRYAHSYVGIGLTPTIAVELNKHTLNSLKEAWIVTRSFWNLRPVVILYEGKKLHIDSLICSTIPEMAKVLTISKNAQPHDGLFEVTIFEHNRKIALILRLIKGIFKHLGAQKRTDKFAFELLMPVPMQLDGEVMEIPSHTEVTVGSCPRLLRTII